MNKIYSKIWSKTRNAMVVVSEVVRGAGKGKSVGQLPPARRMAVDTLLTTLALAGAGLAQAATVDANGITVVLDPNETYEKIHVYNDGTVTAGGNPVTILGNSGPIVSAESGAKIVLDGGGTLETNVSSSSALYVMDADGTLSDIDVSAKGGANAIHARGVSTLDITDGTIKTEGNEAIGIRGTGGVITVSGTRISTDGEEANAIHAEQSANITLNDDVAIKVTGDKSVGVFSRGTASVAMSGGRITTEGDEGYGARTLEEGNVDLNGVTIETAGDDAFGVYSYEDGTVNLDGVVIRTTGERAAGINAQVRASVDASDSQITAEGAQGYGISAVQFSTVAMSGGSIATAGYNGSGVGAYDEAKVRLTENVTIETQGQFARGLFATGDAEISMTGGSIATTGDNAAGVSTLNTSTIEMAGGSITTTGKDSHGVYVVGDSSVVLTDDVAIETLEAFTAGIMSEDDASVDMSGGSITTAADGLGVGATGDSTVTLTDGVTIETAGSTPGMADFTAGILTWDTSTVEMSGGSITTAGGEFGFGVVAANDSSIALTDGVVIETAGDLTAGILSWDNASVTMAGGAVTTVTDESSAIVATNDSTVVLTDDVVIKATGDYANGILSFDNAMINMSDGRIMVSGQDTFGINALDDSVVTLTDGVSIETTGDWNAGIFAEDKASVDMSGGRIVGTGPNALGAGTEGTASLTLNDVSITLTGADALGLFVADDASAHLENVVLDTTGTSIRRDLDGGATATQPIVAANSDLTKNSGVLMDVVGTNLTDTAILKLMDSTRAAGDILDVSPNNRTTLALSSGAQWTGASRLDGNLTLTDTGTATHGGTPAAPIRISGDVTIDNGAALGGNVDVIGMLGGSGGALRPGNSIGTQTFASAGSFTGDYHAEVNAAGESDLITITSGNFDLTGINLYVDEANGNGGYKLDHDYTIVQTGDATGISGVANNEFANGGELEGSLAQSLVKLDPIIYGDDVVKVRLSVDTAKQLTLTHNQNAVLEAAQPNPAVQKAVQLPNYANALDHLSGEIHASTQTALLDTGNLMQRTLNKRMRANAGSPLCVGTTGSDQNRADRGQDCSLDYPLWAQVVGSWNRHDGDSNTAATRYQLGGLYIGGDHAFDNGWRVGGALGFTNGKIRASDRDSKADVKSYTAALYGGRSWALSKGQLNLLLGAGYTYHDIDTNRSNNILGSQSLRAGYHGNSTQLFAELGYAMPLSDTAYVEPYLNVGWTDLHTNRFSESGGSTALRGGSDRNHIFTQTLGLRGGTSVTAGKTDIHVNAGLGWRHANGDRDATRTMSFSQGGGDRFEIKGAPVARSAAVVDLGAEATVGKNTALGLAYSGQFSHRGHNNTGSLYLRMKF